MQTEELQRKLQVSEAKRAKLVVDLHQAQLAIEQLAARNARFSNNNAGDADSIFNSPPSAARLAFNAVGGGSGVAPMSATDMADLANRVVLLEAKLAHSEKARANLLKERESGSFGNGGYASRIPGGVTSISSVSETDADFQHDDEDDAREHARQVMSELVRAMHAQRAAQSEAANLKLQIAEITSQLDAARNREAHLLKMVTQYQNIFASSSGSSSVGAGDDSGFGSTASPVLQLGSSLQSARVKLLEARIQDLTAEVASLRLSSASRSATMVSSGAPGSVNAPSTRNGATRYETAEAERLAKMFSLEQENADLKSALEQQQRLLEKVRGAILAAGLTSHIRS